ncbi:MAG: uracil-DNA glycosylase [Chloroflexota bacterium]
MKSRVARLSAIHTDIYHCTQCPLHEKRTRTVPGAGDPNAEILFIGEAPGFHEDQQGLPFVGKSGQYLEELLATINLTRDDVFIANVVKCRPPDNRDPSTEEIETCNPYLRAQIEVLDPLMIVTLGRYSMGMFFPNAKISAIHGKPKYGVNRIYYPLFHPAYALRNQSVKADMQADVARIPELLREMRKKRAEQIADAGDDAPAPETVEEEITLPSESDSPQQKSLFD